MTKMDIRSLAAARLAPHGVKPEMVQWSRHRMGVLDAMIDGELRSAIIKPGMSPPMVDAQVRKLEVWALQAAGKRASGRAGA